MTNNNRRPQAWSFVLGLFLQLCLLAPWSLKAAGLIAQLNSFVENRGNSLLEFRA